MSVDVVRIQILDLHLGVTGAHQGGFFCLLLHTHNKSARCTKHSQTITALIHKINTGNKILKRYKPTLINARQLYKSNLKNTI